MHPGTCHLSCPGSKAESQGPSGGAEATIKLADIVEPYLGYSEGSIVAAVRILSPADDVMAILAISADGNVTILKDRHRGGHARI